MSSIHTAIHDSTDAVTAERQRNEFVREVLGSRIRDGVFRVASVATQSALVNAGLACARPLVGPLPFAAGFAAVESVLVDPGQPIGSGPAEMASSARGLAEVIAAAPDLPALADNPRRLPFGPRYPPPHAPVFGVAATASGAEWIDDLAALARSHLFQGRRVVAPTDWLAHYPTPLTARETRTAFAHALFALAYTSRGEHAIDANERLHQRARPTLRAGAAELVKRLPSSI